MSAPTKQQWAGPKLLSNYDRRILVYVAGVERATGQGPTFRQLREALDIPQGRCFHKMQRCRKWRYLKWREGVPHSLHVTERGLQAAVCGRHDAIRVLKNPQLADSLLTGQATLHVQRPERAHNSSVAKLGDRDHKHEEDVMSSNLSKAFLAAAKAELHGLKTVNTKAYLRLVVGKRTVGYLNGTRKLRIDIPTDVTGQYEPVTVTTEDDIPAAVQKLVARAAS
jgi:hypothetical protein